MNLLRFTCFLLLAGSAARAGGPQDSLYAVTPQATMADGIRFRITSEALPDGAARFRVVMTEAQAWFSNHPTTEIGLLKDPRSARSISATRPVPATRAGHTLTAVFTVDRQSLQDPNFCFFFSGLRRSFRDTLRMALAPDFAFARLKDFAPRRR